MPCIKLHACIENSTVDYIIRISIPKHDRRVHAHLDAKKAGNPAKKHISCLTLIKTLRNKASWNW